jgi:hypothetical protein
MSRIPHYLDNRLSDGGKVVSLTHFPVTGGINAISISVLKLHDFGDRGIEGGNINEVLKK